MKTVKEISFKFKIVRYKVDFSRNRVAILIQEHSKQYQTLKLKFQSKYLISPFALNNQ